MSTVTSYVNLTPATFKEYTFSANLPNISGYLKPLSYASWQMCYLNKVNCTTSGSGAEMTRTSNIDTASPLLLKNGSETEATYSELSGTTVYNTISSLQNYAVPDNSLYSSLVFKAKGIIKRGNPSANPVVPDTLSDDIVLSLCCKLKTDKTVESMYLCEFGFKESALVKTSVYKVRCPECGEFVWGSKEFGIKIDERIVFGLYVYSEGTAPNMVTKGKVIIPRKSTFLEGIHAPSLSVTVGEKLLPIIEIEQDYTASYDGVFISTFKSG